MRVGEYDKLIADIDSKINGAACAGCQHKTLWESIVSLLERSKKAVRELQTMHYLDRAEIVRLRRMIEAERS